MPSIPGRLRARPLPPAPPAPRRPRLSREQVVAAALTLLDEVGLDELTMRRLAAGLGVQAAALYRHVQDKDELLNLMADALCAGVTVPDPALPWTAQLAAMAWDQRTLLRSHRDAARLIAGTMPTGPERLRLIDATLGILLAAGFAGDEALQIALLLANFVTGAVLEEESNPATAAARAGTPAPAIAAAGAAWLAAIDAGAYPHLRQAALAGSAGYEPEAHFAFGLAVLLAGLEQRRADSAASAIKHPSDGSLPMTTPHPAP